MFLETDGWIDVFFWVKLLDAERGRSACPKHMRSTQACDFSITWTAGECLAVIFAMRDPSNRMFGHLFVGAERASDSALVERIP